METEELVKVYESELKGPNRRGRPLGRWKDRVEEYLGERSINGRGVLEQGGSVRIRRSEDSSAIVHPPEGMFPE